MSEVANEGAFVCLANRSIDFAIPARLAIQGAKKLFLLAVLIGLTAPAFAAHPYLWLDSAELNFMRDKVSNNTADWQALKTECDTVSGYAVLWPHATSGGNSLTRGYVVNPPHAGGVLETGYNGSLWDKAINQLGVCYQAIKTSDPASAAKYLAQAHNIITAISQPLLKLVRQSDGMTRYAVSTYGNGNDLLAGAPLQVVMPYNTAVGVGDIWTISGARGCTSMNGTWKVSSKSDPWSIFFSKPDGTAAPTLNANCTLYSVSISDSYPVRFYMPALAKAYDWFYDGLTSGDISNLRAAMTAWATEMSYCAMHAHLHPAQNYAMGYIWGLVAGYVAFNRDIPAVGAVLNKTLASRFTGAHQLRDYNNLWFAGGGAGEGWQAYGFGSVRRVLDAELAMKIYGVDWSRPPYNFTLLDDTMKYFMQFSTPTLLSLDENEYSHPIGTAYPGAQAGGWFPTEVVWIPLGDSVMYAAMARRFGSSYAASFQGWYDAVYSAEQSAAGTRVPAWSSGVFQSRPELADYFLWYDSGAASSDWTSLPLMYRAWGGNYAVTRTDRSSTATEVTLLGGPTVGAAGNGKTQFESGAVTVQTGNNRLVVYGLGEASRAADIISATQHHILHDERGTYGNKKNAIFWAGASPAETRNQGLTSRTEPPGQINTVTNWPSSIDRAEDGAAYTYFRASHLEANNAKSSIDGQHHQVAWTRELLFLRPKLVVIHDRTKTLYDTDDRAMFWTFGRNIEQVTSGVAYGMTRYDASFKGAYRGAFTSVLPASADVTVVDHDDMHFLYRVEVRPGSMNHMDDTWLAVVDAAQSPQAVNTVTAVQATNADAVQFNDPEKSIVAFANVDPHITPSATIALEGNESSARYIVGLTPGAYYGISTNGGRLIVSTNGPFRASSGGVLVH